MVTKANDYAKDGVSAVDQVCGFDGNSVLSACGASPDVVTVAVGLPDADGLRLARELRDR
ncbi:hypothetical protein [Lentzea atacamensis]|uniref:hypothetical protein n=1 Tax=Lentzea atacamensis TaxID=531938 RepID=UPI001F4039CE|nr:hypothetical protein [Lentzea atacamensis]